MWSMLPQCLRAPAVVTEGDGVWVGDVALAVKRQSGFYFSPWQAVLQKSLPESPSLISLSAT